jgi:hypothetical protein
MRVICEDRPGKHDFSIWFYSELWHLGQFPDVYSCLFHSGGDIVFSGLEKKETLDKLKERPFVLKENCKYKIKILFRVQHDIVTGLKYVNFVYKGGVRG